MSVCMCYYVTETSLCLKNLGFMSIVIAKACFSSEKKAFVSPFSNVTCTLMIMSTLTLLSDMCLYHSFQKQLKCFFPLFFITGC